MGRSKQIFEKLENIFSKFDLTKVFLIVLFAFIAVRLFLLHPTYSDEAYYFNIGRNILKGKTLYKDLFFAHPPLQAYLLAFMFLFRISYQVGKLLPLLASSGSALMIYLIGKELYGKREGFLSGLFFLITPVFLAFSVISHGMWVPTFLVLLSLYLIVREKEFLASFSLIIAFFFRYLSLIYLPFLIIFIFIKKRSIKKFLIPLCVIPLLFYLNFYFFGYEFIDQTISYHLASKFETSSKIQYLEIGKFFLFLSLISSLIFYTKRKKTGLLFSLTPLIVNLSILIALGQIFYHYFLISLPFCMLAIGRVFTISEIKFIKPIILVTLLLSVLINIPTIEFYLNSGHSEKFYRISNLAKNRISKTDKIFGEPIITNYVSFKNKIEISNDPNTYLSYLKYKGVEKVRRDLEKDPPRVFIDMKFKDRWYYSPVPEFTEFLKKYRSIKEVEGIPSYKIHANK